MKKSALILAALLMIGSCGVKSDNVSFSPLTEGFTTLKAEALYRDGMVHHLYPDIDISEITSLPVYKITDNETDDLHTESAIELAEKFDINLDFISQENCTVHDEHTEFPSSECDFFAKNDTTRFYGSESTILISDIEKNLRTISFSTVNHITSFSVSNYCNEVIYMSKIGLSYPENIKNIKVKKEADRIYIEENEEAEIGGWLRDYINSHNEIFPFTAKDFQIEHNISIGERYHTNAVFYENGNASATDVLLGYYDFINNINAAYILSNAGGEEFAEISFSVSKPTFTKEKIGDYELISYEEAKDIFENNENVNYSSDANAETIKDYELRLAYVLDNDNYARPIYVKQENYGWFTEKTGWIDAIK